MISVFHHTFKSHPFLFVTIIFIFLRLRVRRFRLCESGKVSQLFLESVREREVLYWNKSEIVVGLPHGVRNPKADNEISM